MIDVSRVSGGRSRFMRVTTGVWVSAAVALVASAGCSQGGMEVGYADHSRTQVMFYAPPGATVTVKGCSTRSHQIAAEGPHQHRLEYNPEEFSVFNLKPGQYEFKYTTAEGLPGVSVYGELEIHDPDSDEAEVFQRRGFIPVALPSAYYKQVNTIGHEIMPYRGEAFRRAIDDLDLQRLKQGDVIEKVIFVADLERVEAIRDLTEQDIAVTEREIEYANGRFRDAYLDSRIDMTDSWANFWKTDRRHLKWERERISLQQKLTRLEALRDRVDALLRFDHVLVRKGMMVVATEEVVAGHMDPVQAAEELGEVLLVMRIGGRHMHWGDPRVEQAAYGQDGR